MPEVRLTTTRDYFRKQADLCGAAAEHFRSGKAHEPSAVKAEKDAAMWAALADEIDAYLARDPDVPAAPPSTVDHDPLF